MAKVTRLHVALDRLDRTADLPQQAVALPARLRLAETDLFLHIGTSPTSGPSGDLQLPVAADWLAGLVTAFAPRVDRLGGVSIRPCMAVFGCSTTKAILDLMPVAGARLELAAPRGATSWKDLAPPMTAAVILAGLTLPASAATYEVQTGDTLVSISRRLFGSASGWRHLFTRNRQLLHDPDRLVPGMVLMIPETAGPEAAGPAPRQVSSQAEPIIVRAGDTLFALAQRHLGDGARWPELWAGLRHSVRSPAYLPVGLRVPLPATAAGESDQAAIHPRPPSPESRTVSLPATDLPAPQSDATTAARPVTVPLAPIPETPVLAGPSADPGSLAASAGPVARQTPAIASPPPSLTAASFVPAVPTIERPFGTRVGVSFDPVTYGESIAVQQVTAKGTIFNSFGADAAWRIGDRFEVAATYLYNGYPMTRVLPTTDRRNEHHGRIMGYFIWPLLPQLEVAAGLGGQVTGYGVSVGPPLERPADVYDTDFQRVLTQGEAKIGWRPWPDQPLTLTAGLHGIPYGQGFRTGDSAPIRLWGFGWSAGLRYSLNGFALEATYRGQRLFGQDYGQSADLLHTGIGYYFR